jgi:hypothetical protein
MAICWRSGLCRSTRSSLAPTLGAPESALILEEPEWHQGDWVRMGRGGVYRWLGIFYSLGEP